MYRITIIIKNEKGQYRNLEVAQATGIKEARVLAMKYASKSLTKDSHIIDLKSDGTVFNAGWVWRGRNPAGFRFTSPSGVRLLLKDGSLGEKLD